MTRRSHVLDLAGASVLFGVMAVLVRVASRRGFGTWEIVAWRMAIGAVGCLPFLLKETHTVRVQRPGMMLLRILVGASAVLTYFWSIALLPVGLATLFNYLGPVFTALFAARFLGERVGRAFAVGLTLALVGVALTLPGLRGGGALGAAVGIFSAMLQGGAVTFIRELRRTEGAVTIFFWFAATTTVLCLPLALAELHRPNGVDLVVLLGLGLSSLGAQLLLTEALGHTPASTAAMLAPITPLTGFVVGAAALGEPLSVRIAIGAAIAMTGVVIGMRSATRVPPAVSA